MSRHEPSPFKRERLDSLKAQFRLTARRGDSSRLEGIKKLLADKGLSDEEIAQLYVEATLHVDDLPPDFHPDLETAVRLKESLDPHPAECACPTCKPQTGTLPR